MKLIEVRAINQNQVELTDENNNLYTFDMSYFQALPGEWAQELNDYSYFKQVRLSPEWETIEWPHHQDVAPHDIDEFAVLVEDRKQLN